LNNGGFLVHFIDYEIEMMKKPTTSKDAADKVVKNIRRKTRQTYSAEEKIRIVLAGLRGEESISVLCHPLPGRVMRGMIPRGGRVLLRACIVAGQKSFSKLASAGYLATRHGTAGDVA